MPKDYTLKRYQQRVVERMQDPTLSGLVVAHGTGLGKSLTSIATAQKLGLPTNIIPPASLQENYRKELRRWAGPRFPQTTIQSQQRIALQGLQNDRANSLLILDESHRARNPDSMLMQELQRSKAKKKMLLSGSSIYNSPADLGTLVNLAANKQLLPTTKADFNREYVEERPVNPSMLQRFMGMKPGIDYELKNQARLKNILDRYVDYQAGSKEGFPTVRQETVNVPMGAKQQEVYRTVMGKAPWLMRWKVKRGFPPSRSESNNLNAFLGGARQVSNTNEGYTTRKSDVQSPKIDAAFKYLQNQVRQNPRYKGVVYSNYLESGLNPYRNLLQKHRIPFGEFSGQVPAGQRNQAVLDYNAGKLNALLISGAGSEGLDLKGTRLTQLLDPSWNEEREKQVQGRGARYMSHAALPVNEQNMLVQRFMAQPQSSFMDRVMGMKQIHGTDEYMRSVALNKAKLNHQVLALMNQHP